MRFFIVILLFLCFAGSAFGAALGYIPQTQVWWTGATYVIGFYPGGGSTSAHFKYADDDAATTWTTAVDITTADNISDGTDFAMSFSQQAAAVTSYFTLTSGSASELSRFAVEDGSSTDIEAIDTWDDFTTDTIDSPTVSRSAIRTHAAWFNTTDGTVEMGLIDSQYDGYSGSPTGVTVYTVDTLSGTDSVAQALNYGYNVAYSDLESGSWHLNYRTFSGFSTEYDVDTDIYDKQSYRGVTIVSGDASKNDILFVWRDGTDNKLYYRTWDTSAAGLTTEGSINDDTAYNGSGYFTVIADRGNDRKAYIIYYDGTNVVYRTWTDGTISSPTTLFSSPTLTNGNFQTATEASHQFMVAVEDSTVGGDNIDTATVTMTVTERSSIGFLAEDRAAGHSINDQDATHILTYNNKTFVFYGDFGGEGRANVYDETTETWDFSWTEFTENPYWDVAHDGLTAFIDNDGHVYVAEGGRSHPVLELPTFAANDVVIHKSNYPLDNASFSLDKSTDWTDISPTSITGGGYKTILSDGTALYLIFRRNGGGTTHPNYPAVTDIMEYRSGSWSSPIKFWDAESTLWHNDHAYTSGAKMGIESTGQKTIHIGIVDLLANTNVDCGVGSPFLTYINISPDQDGTFTFYDAAGNDLGSPPFNQTSIPYAYGATHNCEGAVDDLNTIYTELDTDSELSVTATSIQATSMDKGNNAMVYDFKANDYISGDYWGMRYTFEIETGTVDGGRAQLMNLQNTTSNPYTVAITANTEYFGSYVGYGGGNYYIYTRYDDGVSFDSFDGYTGLSINTPYYVETIVDWRSETITTYIRTGSHAGTLVDTLSIDISTATKVNFSYVIPLANFAAGPTTQNFTGYIQEIDWMDALLVSRECGLELIDEDTPIFVCGMYDTSDRTGYDDSQYDPGLYAFKYNSTDEVFDQIEITSGTDYNVFNASEKTPIKKTENGDLHVFSKGLSSGVDIIYYTKSEDDGGTWSTPQIISSTTTASGSPAASVVTQYGVNAMFKEYVDGQSRWEIRILPLTLADFVWNGIAIEKINSFAPTIINGIQ